MLVKIVESERDTGFYPILATNSPEAAALLVKSNLVTRMCFAMPSWNASQMVLGMNGAESLPKVQGRGLIVFKARVVEFQSFQVTYPAPSVEAVAYIEATGDGRPGTDVAEEKDRGAEGQRIMALAEDGKTEASIVREIWNVSGGGSYYKRLAQVKAVLADKNTSSSSETALFSSEMGLQGA